ncbi:FtsX-like permease family protein [Haliscomenobacter sp.]|uniref:FtsX-like permease family protein n=1 Tax=Haliscomenobacter sp. TaxID=2717303 RepID=UPI0035931B47
MFRNYLTIVWRNLLKNKLYTGLNVAGLTFGMTCFLFIALFVFDELTFDQQHGKAEQIYPVVEHKNVKGEATTVAAAGLMLAEQARISIPEVENTTRMQRTGRANLVNPENPVNFQETITIADANFLSVFDFPLVVGDRKTALKEPNSILITEDLAMRLFGKIEVLGKMLEWSHLDTPLKITGVLKNHPSNSSFTFNNVMTDAIFEHSNFRRQLGPSDWLSNSFSVYMQLKPGANAENVAGKLKKMVLDHFTPETGTTFSFSLQPLKDMHLKSENIVDGARNSNVEAIPQGNPLYIKIFALVACFILLIAGINYMNLSTARATNRAKEVGVRKSIGAERRNLITQFLLEAVIVSAFSFVLAILLVNVLLPFFNTFTLKGLSLGFDTDYRIWLMAISATVLISLLSGTYPALLLSGLKPVLLLRGIKVKSGSSLSLRKGLVITQFSISTLMIIGTIILYQQVRFLNNTHLGFNKELMVVIDVNSRAARERCETIKTEMSKIPAVKSVSLTSRVPGEWKTYRRVKIHNQGNSPDQKEAYYFAVDRDFTKTFDVQLLSGRNFDKLQDSSSVILNETAAKLLNISEASGQIVAIPSVASEGVFDPLDDENTVFSPRVVGIVKDFHFQSLRDKIEPLVLSYIRNPIHRVDYFTARIEPTAIQTTLEKLKAVMVNADKEDPFEYHFLNEQLAMFYAEDARRQTLMIWAALATIFIACLGLFGLATYSAEQRTKEIGVRKVLGATVLNLSSMLSKDFLKLVVAANVIALPIAFWGANQLLQEYSYHIEIKWWVFVAAVLVSVVIALGTVSYQAVRAALMNPVKSLRSE